MGVVDFFPFPNGYEVQCNVIWALTDFTEENGATHVVPGSNRAEDGVVFAASNTSRRRWSAGCCPSGGVYHGGGANHGETTRVGVNITYNVAWLRQEENQYISVPREVAETLPIELLRLMGYARGAYALGYIDDLRDPIEAVGPGAGSVGFAAGPTTAAPQGAGVATPGGGSGGGRRSTGRDPPGHGTRLRRALCSLTRDRRRRRRISNGPHADPGGVRRLLDRARFGGVDRSGGRPAGRGVLRQAEFRGQGGAYLECGLLRAGAAPRPGIRGAGWSSIRCTRLAGSDSTPCSSIWSLPPIRPTTCTEPWVFQEVGRIPAAVDGEDAVVYWRGLEEEDR